MQWFQCWSSVKLHKNNKKKKKRRREKNHIKIKHEPEHQNGQPSVTRADIYLNRARSSEMCAQRNGTTELGREGPRDVADAKNERQQN